LINISIIVLALSYQINKLTSCKPQPICSNCTSRTAR